MKRILFVDDDSKLLDGLRRSLRSLRNDFEMEFASSGPEALEILLRKQFEIIVTDMRMPGMSGAALLAEVANRHPQMIRIILSGTWDQDLRMQAVMTAHQYLSKPCDPETLRSTIGRAFALRDVLLQPAIKECVMRVGSLPSAPLVYQQFTQALRLPDISAREIGTIIAKDPAMTAKVLQLVNSAFFDICRRTANPVEAVVYLGMDAMRALGQSVSVFSAFDGPQSTRSLIAALQEHCMSAAITAVAVARAMNTSQLMLDDAMVAGLLHDLGKLVLAVHFPSEYDRILATASATEPEQLDAERAVFGTTHAEIGGYLLWLWGLPDSIVEAVTFHHRPAQSSAQGFSAVAAVYAAEVLEWNASSNGSSKGVPLGWDYFAALGLAEEFPQWAAARQRLKDGEACQ
ncbi:MAG TPA: response regulator [Terriglobales bacterium]|nr:response regulator [Terriglobales bacterium]